MITERAEDVQLVPYANVTFPCVAKSDPSRPLTRRWYYDDSPVANDTRMFVVSNGSLVVRLGQFEEGGIYLTGTFLCHVTNGYSSDEAYARLLSDAERTYSTTTNSIIKYCLTIYCLHR